jgi:hypothetical protein
MGPDTWWTMGRWSAQRMVLCESDVMHRTERSHRTDVVRSTGELGSERCVERRRTREGGERRTR